MALHDALDVEQHPSFHDDMEVWGQLLEGQELELQRGSVAVDALALR